jgi:hypothetical protein
MKSINLKQLKHQASALNNADKQWHFHILTPECVLNNSGKFALIIENTTDEDISEYYFNEAPMELGKELVKLLYGNKILKEEKVTKPMPPEMQAMINRAKELSIQGKHWHHHMLFPSCIYNKHKDKYSILFEDPETKEMMEYLSNDNPVEELNEMEILYYNQKSLS